MAETKRLVCEEIDRRGEEIIAVAREVLAHPEPGFRETKTARVVADRFRALGMAPKEGIALTGVKARLETGRPGPNVAVMGELDSLIVPGHPHADPETGAAHACGHHCQIASMLGALVGLLPGDVLGNLSGNITFIAVPAEEYIEIEWRNQLRVEGKLEFLGGKPEFIRLGELDDVDMAMMTHTGSGSDPCAFGVGSSNTGIVAKLIRFTGV
ncbi:MAG: amidohydrolase, partial [Chloroflexi bacterium]|nr:amidohydrolase [Chloroflexota bacterium]